MGKRTAERISGSEARRFDAFRLATRGEALAGEMDVKRRERIVDRLAATDVPAAIAWRIEGGRDARERPMLTLSLRGSLPLLCQRCLQRFDAVIEQASELLLARDEADLARLDADEREVVLGTVPLDALTLIEDELLLSLPFAPMHPEGQCPATPTSTAETGDVRKEPGDVSPFARLVALKKGRDKTHEE
jgi:DUF177 domain-containing protein